MKFDTALTILFKQFNGAYNRAEKLMLLNMKENSQSVRTTAILNDLLTNDFDCENSGYLLSSLDEYYDVFSKRDIIGLATACVAWMNKANKTKKLLCQAINKRDGLIKERHSLAKKLKDVDDGILFDDLINQIYSLTARIKTTDSVIIVLSITP